MKTKSESALEFINQMILMGKTVFVCTAIKAIKITPATFTKWSKSDYKLFKIDASGNLLMARGRNYYVIISKNISHVSIKAQ